MEQTTSISPTVRPPATPAKAVTNGAATSNDEAHLAGLRRINDYHASSLRQEDALNAAIGVYNADLLWIGAHVQKAIKQYLADSPCTLEYLQRVAPTLETSMQVARQIDRFSQIELQERRRREKIAASANNK